MYYYAASLRQANFIMVNSTWTKNHIDAILQHTDLIMDSFNLIPSLFLSLFKPFSQGDPLTSARVVYPPCNTREMAKFPLENRERVILSVAQFRYLEYISEFPSCTDDKLSPEKDHAAQIKAFKVLLQSHPEYKTDKRDAPRLVLLGGSRNDEDAARDRKSTRLNSSHSGESRMPSSA